MIYRKLLDYYVMKYRYLINTYRNISSVTSHQQTMMAKGLPKRVPINGVKHIIAIASGKGGVGKSSVSVNLALALSKLSYNVGLLDADIYGPSLPTMMNLTNKKVEVNSHNNLLEPLYNYNIKCMSMGFLTKSDGPVVWRGLMVMSAIEKMLKQVNWKPLDYLVIDMPPGTGDIQLSISQLTSISGIVIVTTPQEISVIDVRKAIGMFQLVNVPILGIIENMSTYTCQKCSHEEHIFGVNGGTNLAKEFKTTVLEFLPINISFRQACDEGKPYVIVNDSDDQMIRKFETIAQKIVKQIPIKQNEQVEQK